VTLKLGGITARKRFGAGEGNRTLVFSLEGFRRLRTINTHSDKSSRSPALRTINFPELSEPVSPLICERDDGQFQIGLGDAAAGPFPTRAFAESVALADTTSAVSP
jgi:hypothetical protein